MHTKGPKEDPLVDLGYETRDIDIQTIKKAVIAFFAFATVMFVVGAWIYANMNTAFKPEFIAEKDNLRIPKSPNPLLEDNTSNTTDIMAVRQHETAVLTSTGWADDKHTFAHIPIEKAIDLLVERGLPKTGAVIPAVSKGNTTDEKKAAKAGGPQDNFPGVHNDHFATAPVTPGAKLQLVPKAQN